MEVSLLRYAIADSHGQRGLFERMLEEIGFSDDDELYILGDIVDRGPDPFGIMDIIMGRKNVIKLKGNHEGMMLAALETRGSFEMNAWIQNGGGVTLNLLDRMPKRQRDAYLDEVRSWPLYAVVGNFILVHAGYWVSALKEYENADTLLSHQPEETLVWSRDFYLTPGLKGYITVFGHTPTPHIHRDLGQRPPEVASIWRDTRWNNKYGIDCGATYKGGRLACLRLDDLREFYVAA